MRSELLSCLELDPMSVVTIESELDRPNLYLEIHPKLSPDASADHIVKLVRCSGSAGRRVCRTATAPTLQTERRPRASTCTDLARRTRVRLDPSHAALPLLR